MVELNYSWFYYDANGTKLRTDYYINPMTAVVPQASNQAANRLSWEKGRTAYETVK